MVSAYSRGMICEDDSVCTLSKKYTFSWSTSLNFQLFHKYAGQYVPKHINTNIKIISIIYEYENYASENYIIFPPRFKNLVIVTMLKHNIYMLMKPGTRGQN